MADIFTKSFFRARFQFLCSKLNLVPSPRFNFWEDDKPIHSGNRISMMSFIHKAAVMKPKEEYHSASTKELLHNDKWLDLG